MALACSSPSSPSPSPSFASPPFSPTRPNFLPLYPLFSHSPSLPNVVRNAKSILYLCQKSYTKDNYYMLNIAILPHYQLLSTGTCTIQIVHAAQMVILHPTRRSYGKRHHLFGLAVMGSAPHESGDNHCQNLKHNNNSSRVQTTTAAQTATSTSSTPSTSSRTSK